MTFKKKNDVKIDDSFDLDLDDEKVITNTNQLQKIDNKERLKKQGFQPGHKLSPGRPKGSRHKFSETFMKDFLEDWEDHGATAIKKVRQTDPSTYLRVAAGLLPKELNIKDEDRTLDRLLEKFSIDELDQFIISITNIGFAEQSNQIKDAEALTIESTEL